MFKKIIQKLLGQPEGYVSPIDHFLTELRKKNPRKSLSQIDEITRYQEIYRLRDGKVVKRESNHLWRNF
jgi:hypothetical protein